MRILGVYIQHDACAAIFDDYKLIAAVGVSDLVVVDTHDALLICPRDRAQDVGRIVKELEAQKHHKLL